MAAQVWSNRPRAGKEVHSSKRSELAAERRWRKGRKGEGRGGSVLCVLSRRLLYIKEQSFCDVRTRETLLRDDREATRTCPARAPGRSPQADLAHPPINSTRHPYSGAAWLPPTLAQDKMRVAHQSRAMVPRCGASVDISDPPAGLTCLDRSPCSTSPPHALP